MPWFMIDDGFWSHPKTLQLSDGAQALWMRAGSWSMKHLTDGFIPDFALPILSAKPRFADELRTVSLWFSVKDGNQFHDWNMYQRSREEVEQERRDNAERKRKSRQQSRGESHRDTGRSHTVSPEAQSSPFPTLLTTTPISISPVPNREGGIDVDRVIAGVQKHCGRDCSQAGAFLIIGTVMDRAKTKPKDRTAFVLKAIQNDPFVWQQLLDEVA